VTIVGAGRLAEGVAVRALAGGHRLRIVNSEPGIGPELELRAAARRFADEVRERERQRQASRDHSIATLLNLT
jgi:hypothetical protein